MRTSEDRSPVNRNRIAVSGALESQRAFLVLYPGLTERYHLLSVFRELSHLLGKEWAPNAAVRDSLGPILSHRLAEDDCFSVIQADTVRVG